MRTDPLIVAHNGAAAFGGAELWTVRLLKALQERGNDVLFLCRDEEMRARAEAHGVPAAVARLGGHASLHDAARFALLLRRLRPSGLLLSTFKKTWLGGMGASWAGVPRVVARVGMASDRPGRRRVYRLAFSRWIDRVVVNADGLRRGVLEDVPSLEPRQVVTLYNGVRPLPVRRPAGALRRELGLSSDARVLGVVARLVPEKRVDRLLAVLQRLPRLHALIAGDGEARAALESRADLLGVADRAHFLGHRDDVGDVLAALDLFVLTSEVEGMSNAMLEALAAGVPVVSTPVSGAAEALDPLPDGRRPGIVAPADVDAIAAAVAEVVLPPGRLREMAGAARARARQRFDPATKAARWETLLAHDVMADVHEGPSAIDRRPA